MRGRALRTCYRALLRQVREVQRGGLTLSLQAPVSRDEWRKLGGAHAWAKVGLEHRRHIAQQLLPWMAERLAAVEALSALNLRALIGSEFRHPRPEVDPELEDLDRALQAIRVLGDQVHLARSSSRAVTQGVQVEVTAEYVGKVLEFGQLVRVGSAIIGVEDDSDDEGEEDELEEILAVDEHDDSADAPEHSSQSLHYAYRVRVTNIGTEPVQLLGRHWIIQDRHGTVVTEVPHGTRGVVGCTPIIKPGTCFQYYSAADLESAPGTMRGSFQMAVLDDRQQPQTRFDAEVAPFHFWPPPAQSG